MQLLNKAGLLNVPSWYSAGKVAQESSNIPFGAPPPHLHAALSSVTWILSIDLCECFDALNLLACIEQPIVVLRKMVCAAAAALHDRSLHFCTAWLKGCMFEL